MGQRLRAFDARHPVVYDLLVTLAVALLGVVGLADGSLDATVAPVVPEPPLALPVVLHLAFTVPLLWRRTHPLVVLWVLAATTGIMVWSGLDHPGVLSVLVVGYSAAVREPLSRLAPPGAALVGVVGASSVRWHPDDVGAQYVPLLLTLLVVALLGLTVRTRRDHHESQVGLAIAAERARIAREMHDVVAHNLAVMVALADGAAYSLPQAPQQATDLVEKAATTGREALADMRRLVGVLRDDEHSTASATGTAGPPRPQPGFDDIDALVDQVREAGLTVRLTRVSAPGSWGPSAGLTMYRIVQEALTNTMKHAGLRATVDIRMHFTTDELHLEVVDDGGGHHPARPSERRPGHDRRHHDDRSDGNDGVGDRGGHRDRSGDDRVSDHEGSHDDRSGDDWGTGEGRHGGGSGHDCHGDGYGGGSGHDSHGHGLAGMAERVAAYDGRLQAGPDPAGGWRVAVRLRFDRSDQQPDQGLSPPPRQRSVQRSGQRSDQRPDSGAGQSAQRSGQGSGQRSGRGPSHMIDRRAGGGSPA